MKKNLLKLTAVLLLAVIMLCSCAKPVSAPFVESRIFTDSCGREVNVPVSIEKIAISGSLAQMYLFALCPDKLAGLAGDWSEDARAYISPDYYDLPILGQMYGSKGNLNRETIISTGAQIIIDVGESKDSIAEDMDDIQNQTRIPTVHIDAYLNNTADAFRMLGDLLGLEEDAEKLAVYCEEAMKLAGEVAAKADRVSLLYLDGDLGLNVMAKDSYHSEVVDMLTDNLAVLDNASGKGLGNEVDMEQLLNWNPDCIIFAPQSFYPYVAEEKEWQGMKAVRDGNYYEVPYGPYNWMGTPPSCQRYLGMLWLAKLLYPDLADYDLYEEAREFYSLFVHYELDRDTYDLLVAESVGKIE